MSFLGLLLTAVHLFHVSVMDMSLMATITGALIPLLLSLGIVYLGYWIFRSETTYTVRFCAWAIAGAAALGTTGGLVLYHHYLVGSLTLLDHFTVGNMITLGAYLGAFVGHYDSVSQGQKRTLQQQESRFRALTESSSFVVLTIDETSTIRYANDAIDEIFGYQSADLLGEPVTKLMPERFRDAHQRGLNRYLSEGVPSLDWDGIELTGLHADGEEFPIEVSFGEYVVADGHLFTGIVRDISDRKEAEDQLQAHTDKLTKLHEVATHVTAAETEDDIYRRTVHGAADLFPCDVARFSVAAGDDLTPTASSIDDSPDDVDPLPAVKYAGRTYRSGQPVRIDDLTDTRSVASSDVPPDVESGDLPEPLVESGGDHPSGSARGVHRSLLSVPVDDYGALELFAGEANAFDKRDEELAVLLAAHATTALGRVEAEATIRRERDRLDQFASLLSHDLRNPLNVAQGRAKLARETGSFEHLAAVERAHDRIAHLIDDMLTLARQGTGIGDTETVDLASVAREGWDNITTAEAAIRIDVRNPVEADRSRLLQLFENLYRNAIEHGNESATITVGQLDRGFYVEDTGPGIPADERDRVFESGYTTSDDGTGLGLAIVERIVEAHGWEIDVTEGSDGGARFEISGVEIGDG